MSREELEKAYDEVNPNLDKETKFSKEVIDELNKKIAYEEKAIIHLEQQLKNRKTLGIQFDYKVDLMIDKIDSKKRAIKKLKSAFG